MGRGTVELPTAREILSERGAPIVVFDHVQLAFDEKVVLKDVSFTLIKGHTKIILGASGSGISTTLKIITGLLRADSGVVWVNGQRVDQLSEKEMMSPSRSMMNSASRSFSRVARTISTAPFLFRTAMCSAT